jgi:protein-S-isoprenylcysteine O-methyltransferase Ste14
MRHIKNSCLRLLDYRPPRIAMTLLALASLVHVAAPITWLHLPSFLIAGAFLVALGFSIMIRAWWLFGQHKTAICPTAATTAFISDDIYALTRNPMYLGMVLMMLGIASLVGSWLFYIVALAYALILDHVFCHYEEQKLLHQFGEQYAAYATRVRRWL